ncbi:MAG: lipocalin family protein [bacterium]
MKSLRTIFIPALILIAFTISAHAAEEQMRDLQFPRDAGGHKAGIEWWYINGNLKDAEGNEYGIMAAFFKVEQMATMGYFDMLGVTDAANKKHYSISMADRQSADMTSGIVNMALKKNPQNESLKELLDYYNANHSRITFVEPAKVKNDRLSVNYGSNYIEQPSKEKLDFDVYYAFDDIAVKMNMSVMKSPMLIGGKGNIDMASGGKSYYYSLTRIDASGAIKIGDSLIPVTGIAWMDHQWGNWDQRGYKGWDWFSAQLENGMDFNLFSFRGTNDNQIDATVTILDGDKTIVSKKMELESHKTWTNPETGTTYPLVWTIRLPEQDITLDISPVVTEQEMLLVKQFGAIWEGNTKVTASVRGKKVSGVGYAELTGYAPGMMEILSTK